MKKFLVSVAAGACALQLVNADQLKVQPAEVVVTDEECCNDTSFDGLFLGLGLGGSFYKNKITLEDGDAPKQKVDRVIGTVLLGGGRVVNDTVYVGVDVLADFAKKKNKEIATGENAEEDAGVVTVKNEAFSPSVGLRFGYVRADWNSMFYFRVSGVRTAVSYRDGDGHKIGSCHKIAPAFALGWEKQFSNKLSSRLEVEYKVAAKKTVTDQIKLKNNRGFNVRLLCTYKVKM